MREWLLRVGGASALMMFAAVVAGGPANARSANASAQGPEATYRAYVAAANAQDVPAELALLDPNVTSVSDGEDGWTSNKVIGRDAFQSSLAPGNPNVTIDSLNVQGNTVTVVWEGHDVTAAPAGVTRYVWRTTATVVNGLITSLVNTPDLTDAQTAKYINYYKPIFAPNPPSAPPAGALTVTIGSGADGSQPGTAYITKLSDTVTQVLVYVSPGQPKVRQASNLNTGPCSAPGSVLYGLADVVDGAANTDISAPFDQIVAQAKSIDVHQVAQPSLVNACGDVSAAAAAPTATPAAPATPAPAPTVSGVVSAPSTGTGPSGGGDAWLLTSVALAVGLCGMLCVIGGRRLEATLRRRR